MKCIVSILLLSIMVCILSANMEAPKQASPDQLTTDRIRNVMAVDTKDMLYAATFGLEAFNPLFPSDVPDGIKGELIKFRIVDGSNYYIQDRKAVTMDGPCLNVGASFNAYREIDPETMKKFFKKEEIFQRYKGATGCWASPVICQDGNSINDVIYILNKSGMLFCMDMDFADGSGNCRWFVNLRDYERETDDNLRFEYMATPTLFKDYLYIAGIRKLFIIDRNNGNLINITLELVGGDDHFIAPIAYDTNSDSRELFATSKQGKMFRLSEPFTPNNYNTNTIITRGYTPPLVDTSGHIFVTGLQDTFWNPFPLFDYASQYLRYNPCAVVDEYRNYDSHEQGYGGTILSDSFKGLYFLGDHSLDYYLKEYDCSGFGGYTHFDPLIFSNPMNVNLNEGFGYRYVNNHPALMERADNDASLIASINNSAVEPEYYPSNSTLADISGQYVKLSFVTNKYGNYPPDLYTDDRVTYRYCSWGGITPYATRTGIMSIIFGDEEGKVFTYPAGITNLDHFDPFPPSYLLEQSLYSPVGFGKHQQGRGNIINREVISVFKVYVRCHGEYETFVYANGYGRGTQYEVINYNGENIPVYTATYTYLLSHPRYTINVLQSQTPGVYSQYTVNNVDISQGNILINPGSRDGGFTYVNETQINRETEQSNYKDYTPLTLRVDSIYPNPFNPSTSISFTAPRDGNVNVTVYNTKGQIVKELLNQNMSSGHHNIVWTGTDNANNSVSSGIYFVRIKQDNLVTNKKMILSK